MEVASSHILPCRYKEHGGCQYLPFIISSIKSSSLVKNPVCSLLYVDGLRVVVTTCMNKVGQQHEEIIFLTLGYIANGMNTANSKLFIKFKLRLI